LGGIEVVNEIGPEILLSNKHQHLFAVARGCGLVNRRAFSSSSSSSPSSLHALCGCSVTNPVARERELVTGDGAYFYLLSQLEPVSSAYVEVMCRGFLFLFAPFL
jgi:hypothetical protein